MAKLTLYNGRTVKIKAKNSRGVGRTVDITINGISVAFIDSDGTLNRYYNESYNSTDREDLIALGIPLNDRYQIVDTN